MRLLAILVFLGSLTAHAARGIMRELKVMTDLQAQMQYFRAQRDQLDRDVHELRDLIDHQRWRSAREFASQVSHDVRSATRAWNGLDAIFTGARADGRELYKISLLNAVEDPDVRDYLAFRRQTRFDNGAPMSELVRA